MPTLQGKKVFLMLSRQALRQTKAAVPIKPFMYFVRIGTPALPFGCFVTLRSLSHSLLLLQPSFGQLLVSFATSFITFYVPLPLHRVRTYAVASLHGFPPATILKPTHGGKHIPFRKAHGTILTGVH